MTHQKGGSIINLSSSIARGAYANFGAYAVSKWGIEGFTQTLAAELESYRIRVNSVDPGTWRQNSPIIPAASRSRSPSFLSFSLPMNPKGSRAGDSVPPAGDLKSDRDIDRDRRSGVRRSLSRISVFFCLLLLEQV